MLRFLNALFTVMVMCFVCAFCMFPIVALTDVIQSSPWHSFEMMSAWVVLSVILVVIFKS